MDNDNINKQSNAVPAQPPKPPTEPVQPELKPKPKTDKLGVISVILAVFLPPVGFILGLIGVSKAKKENRSPAMSRIGWILGLIISIPLLLFFSLIWLLSSVYPDNPGPHQSTKVQGAYVKAADKLAKSTTLKVNGATMFYSKLIASDHNKSQGNKIQKTFCFTTDNSRTAISQVAYSFLNYTSAEWQNPALTFKGQDVAYDGNQKEFLDDSITQITDSGATSYNVGTVQGDSSDGKPIKTNNPNYYAQGSADVTFSLPSYNDECSKVAKQMRLIIKNNYILSLTFDLSDNPAQLPF